MMTKKAIRFTICKKLAQLHKIIDLFDGMRAEIDYDRSLLCKRYDAEIGRNLDDCQKKIRSIQSLLDGESGKVNDRSLTVLRNHENETILEFKQIVQCMSKRWTNSRRFSSLK
jgi:flagellin-specific chaperone FliS